MKHDVVIVGAGPTGLMLAGELALAGIDVALVERRPDQELEGSRAGGLHARVIELLDQRGIADRFLAEGKTMQALSFASHVLDISDLPSRHPYVLALWQSHIERILAGWVAELKVPIIRGVFERFSQHDRVTVTLSDGRTIDASYLVGCDGGRSAIRKQAGIDFPGWEASTSYLIAEGEVTGEPPIGIRRTSKGVNGIGKIDGGGVRIVLCEPEVERGDRPTLDELRAALVAVFGVDYGVHSVTWLSRFTDATRQATSYRAGRVLLAGDAAHIHSPAGGQGLNLGIYDAVNLGWKLARVVRGAPASLLETYQAERHPITAHILRTTMATTAVNRGDDQTTALRDELAAILKLDQARLRYAGLMSGLDTHYDLGPGHPLLGRRMPDLELDIGRVYSLLHDARPLLLDFGALDSPPSLRHVVARFSGEWKLPVIGVVPPPAAVLIRPDGYVAWVSDGSDAGLAEALARWCA